MGSVAEDPLIDQIYSASFEPARWIGVMEQLCDGVDAHTACLTELDIIDGSGEGITARADQSSIQDYMTNWTDRNSLLLVDDPVRYHRDWRLAVIRDREWMLPDLLHKTSYYNDFLRPLGAEHSIMMRISLEGTVVSALNIARTNRKGAFEDAEIARVARFQPHIIRAVQMSRRLRLANSAFDQLDTLLETSHKALFFVNRSGQVRHCTAAAEGLLRSNSTLALHQGRLHAADAEADGRLHMLIGKTLQGADLPIDSSILIHSANGGPSLLLSASLLGRRSTRAFSSEPLALVGAVEIGAPVSPVERLLAAFKLTAAEARVALLLGEGLKVQQIAAKCGSSVHTVRAQLGAIFSKTGCHRQADLVRLLLQERLIGGHRPS